MGPVEMFNWEVVNGPDIWDIMKSLTAPRRTSWKNPGDEYNFRRNPRALEFTLTNKGTKKKLIGFLRLLGGEPVTQGQLFHLTLERCQFGHERRDVKGDVEINCYDFVRRKGNVYLPIFLGEPVSTSAAEAPSTSIRPDHLVMATLPSEEQALGKVISLPDTTGRQVYLHVVLLRGYDPESGVPSLTLVEPGKVRLATLAEIKQGFNDWHLGNPNRLRPEVVQLGTGYAIRS